MDFLRKRCAWLYAPGLLILGASAAFSATVPVITSTATVRVVRVRYIPDAACRAVDTTITPVAIMAPIGGTNNVRATIVPAAQATRVGFDSANTGIATVTPAAATGSPQVLQIGGVTNDETLIRARTATSGILRTLTAGGKPRLDRTLVIHAVTEQNDDVQVVPIGRGEPNQTCVTAGTDELNTTRGGDDVLVGTTSIHTGTNGICDSFAAADDVQVIAVGQGRPNRLCVGQGANGFRDTLDSQIQGDDAVAGNDINSGANGICQTLPNATNAAAPLDVPTAAAVQTHLNAVWGLQANVFFTVTRADVIRNYDLNRDGDLSDPPDFSSFDEVDAMTAGITSTANYNIYFVRSYSHPVAYTEVTRDEAYIGDAKQATSTAVYVVAHEMGHLLGRIGHDNSSNLNLMFGGDLGTNPCEVRRADWRAVNP